MITTDQFPIPATEEEHQPENNSVKSEQTNASSHTENTSRSSFFCSNKKEDVEAMYHTLLNDLNSFKQNLSTINAKNAELKNLKLGLVNRLQMLTQETKLEAEKALHEIPWDRLVIAFFGETNAGKSSIIETFRVLFDDKRTKDNDGLIVGDGRQDFTQDYHEYNFSINSRPFTLIDVPGIEGNESEFKDIIKVALRKAHCVFYVQGHNKKPDSATAKKIKNYLGNWVNVYSIQNIRGSVSDYDEEEERETLLTPNVLKNEGLIRNAFKEILGDVYKGNIPLQALLAMCAKARFSKQRSDLQKNQVKLLKYFNNADEILKFSQFQTIINLVNEKSNNFTEEIAKSNRQKVIALCDRVNAEIEKILNQEKENTERLRNQLIEFRRDSKGIISSTGTTLQNKLDTKMSNEFNLLKQSLFGIIDGGGKNVKNDAKRKVYQFKYSLISSLDDIVEQEIDKMKQKLNTKKKKLEGIKLSSDFDFKFFFHVDINTEDALNELELNLDDIGDFAISAAGTAAVGAGIGSLFGPGPGTLIGVIVGGVVGGVSNVFVHNNGKGDAKNVISQDIENSKKEVKKSISSSLKEIKCELHAELLKVEKVLNKELENLETVNDITTRIQQRMNATMRKYKN